MTTLTMEQKLLTAAWTKDVRAVVTAVRGFRSRRALKTSCRVVLFELEGDRLLHVNVTHEHPTSTPSGWSGPGIISEGFVHNRRFSTTQPREIVRKIREMVFAPRDRSSAS